MKNYILLLCICVSVCVKSQTAIYHFKKLKAAEGLMKKGEKEGLWTYWSHLGYPLKEENYKNGKLNGKSLYYVSDNRDMETSSIDDMAKDKELYQLRLKRQKAFEENKEEWKILLKNNFYLIDKVVCYTDNKVDSINIYKKNKFKEQITYPFSDTTVYTIKTFQPYSYKDSSNFNIEETTYKNGKKNGPYKKYNTKYEGEISVSGSYADGKKDGEWTWAADKYSPKEVIRYKNDKRDGLTEKVIDGNYIDSTFYVNGKKEGLCKSYKKSYSYKDKDTSFIYANYSAGYLNGPQTTYKSGQVTEIVNYKNDRRDGVTTEYFKNGGLKSNGYYTDGKRDSLWQYWNDKKTLLSSTLYRNKEIMKDESYYEDGKLRYSLIKKGESSNETWYYADGKKKKQKEKTPDKETLTKWDEKGKKEVDVKDKKPGKNRYDEIEPPREYSKTKIGSSEQNGTEDVESPYRSKSVDGYSKSKYESKYDKKDKGTSRAEFDGGKDRQDRFLILLTKNDRKEETGGFNVVTAITVNETGEIIYIKATDNEKKKVKKKYLKEAERIVLVMPKWESARNAGKPITENTGFNIWFFEK